MSNIIVAIIINLVAALILVSGVISAIHNGVKVTLVKLGLVAAGGVGAFFLAPVISRVFYGIVGVPELLEDTIKVSTNSVNALLFTLVFLIFYALSLCVCNIVRHCFIKRLRDKKMNSLKMKRAKSINPKAEKEVKRSEWKELKALNKAKRRWYHRLISTIVGTVIAIAVSYVVIMPYGYIAKDIVANDETKQYLVDGYEYTLNGVIGDKVSDFLLGVKDEESAPEEEIPEGESPEETPEVPEEEQAPIE